MSMHCPPPPSKHKLIPYTGKLISLKTKEVEDKVKVYKFSNKVVDIDWESLTSQGLDDVEKCYSVVVRGILDPDAEIDKIIHFCEIARNLLRNRMGPYYFQLYTYIGLDIAVDEVKADIEKLTTMRSDAMSILDSIRSNEMSEEEMERITGDYMRRMATERALQRHPVAVAEEGSEDAVDPVDAGVDDAATPSFAWEPILDLNIVAISEAGILSDDGLVLKDLLTSLESLDTLALSKEDDRFNSRLNIVHLARALQLAVEQAQFLVEYAGILVENHRKQFVDVNKVLEDLMS